MDQMAQMEQFIITFTWVVIVISLAIAGTVGVFVGKDANARGMNGIFWGLAVFAMMIVFLPLYALVRKPLISSLPAKRIGE